MDSARNVSDLIRRLSLTASELELCAANVATSICLSVRVTLDVLRSVGDVLLIR